MKVRIFKYFIFSFLTFCSTANGQTLTFSDQSGFGNYVVFQYNDDSQENLLHQIEGEFVANLNEYEPGEEVLFGVLFRTPNVLGSADLVPIRELGKMQIDILVRVPKNRDSDLRIPVYYLTAIGAAGFRELRRLPLNSTEASFEKFFKGALMAEHYRQTLEGQSTSDFRKAVDFWLEGSQQVSKYAKGWWRMDSSFVSASELAHGPGTRAHQKRVDRWKAINE